MAEEKKESEIEKLPAESTESVQKKSSGEKLEELLVKIGKAFDESDLSEVSKCIADAEKYVFA